MRTAGFQTWNQVNSEAKIHSCQWNFDRTEGICRENNLNWWLQVYKISINQPKRVDKTRVKLPLNIGA
jgi:hypothetical protein